MLMHDTGMASRGAGANKYNSMIQPREISVHRRYSHLDHTLIVIILTWKNP